jgi:DNA-binding transcriptional LysR family regulator
MVIEHRHLRRFVTLAEELHFSRASRLLHLAQPALSQSIQQLEEAIGTKLIERTTRRIELTAAGQTFYEHARRILQNLETGVASTLKAARDERQLIVFGFTSAGLYGQLPELIRKFRVKHPNAQIAFREYGPDALITAIRTGAVDVAVVYGHCSEPLLNGTTISVDGCVLAVPKGHRLASFRRAVSLKQLTGEELLAPPRTGFYGLYEIITAACLRANVDFHLTTPASNVHALPGLVAAGLGLALIPSSLAESRKYVVYKELSGEPVHFDCRLYWPRDQRSLATDEFLAVSVKGFETGHSGAGKKGSS